MAGDETIIGGGGGRFDTDRNGDTATRTYARRWPA
jgi:hypothetical protein